MTLPVDLAANSQEEMVVANREKIDNLLKEPRDYNPPEPTDPERWVWGTDPNLRATHQSVFEGQMHRLADWRSQFGQVVVLDDKDNIPGWQSYLIGFTGSLLGNKRGLEGKSHTDLFGATDYLEQMHQNFGPNGIRAAVEVIKKHPIDQLSSSVLEKAKCEYKASDYGGTFDLIFGYVEVDKPRELKGDLPAFVSQIKALKRLLSNQEYQEVPITKQISDELTHLLSGNMINSLAKVLESNQAASISAKRWMTEEQTEQCVSILRGSFAERQLLQAVLYKCQSLSTLARHDQIFEDKKKSSTKPQGDISGIRLVNAKSPLHVLRRANHRLRRGDPQEKNPDKLQYWPVAQFERPGDIRKAVIEALELDVIGFNFELTHDKPIVVVSAPNGSGKTSFLLGVAQAILQHRLTGGNPYADEMQSEPTNPPVCLVNTAVDSVDASTFMQEMYAVIRRQAQPLSTAVSRLPNIHLYDEVGRGTSSDEAANLINAMCEVAAHDGDFVILSTHAAKELYEKAKKTGLDKKMRFVTINPDTHQVIEVDGPVDSRGMEYFQTIPHKQSPLSRALQKRVLHIQKAQQKNQPVPKEDIFEAAIKEQREKGENKPPLFCDIASLEALGLGNTKDRSQVWSGLSAVADRASRVNNTIAPVLRHAEHAITFDQSITKGDTEIIRELPKLIAREGVDVPTFHGLVMDGLQTYTEITNLPISESVLAKIKAYTSKNKISGRDSVGISAESQEHLKAFLMKYIYPDVLAQSLYGRKSSLDRVNSVLGRELNSSVIQQMSDLIAMTRIGARLELAVSNAIKVESRLLINLLDDDLIKRVSTHQNRFTQQDLVSLSAAVDTEGIGLNDIGTYIRSALSEEGKGSQKPLVRNWLLSQYLASDNRSNAIKQILTDSEYDSVFQLTRSAKNHFAQLNTINTKARYSGREINELVLSALLEGSAEPIIKINQAVLASKLDGQLFGAELKLSELMQKLDLQVFVELQSTLDKIEELDSGISQRRGALDRLAYCSALLTAHGTLGCGRGQVSTDGALKIVNAYPLEQLAKKIPSKLVRQTVWLRGDTEIAMSVGLNGNGKSQLDKMIGVFHILHTLSGLAFAEDAVVPNVPYIRVIQNAGLSTATRSSFNNEGKTVLNAMTDLPLPDPDGSAQALFIYDEIGQTTSNNDQRALVPGIVEGLRAMRCQLLCTTHNKEIYDGLAACGIDKVQVFAFPYNPTQPYKMTEIDLAAARNIKSGGLMVAEKMGMPPHIINIAKCYEGIPL